MTVRGGNASRQIKGSPQVDPEVLLDEIICKKCNGSNS